MADPPDTLKYFHKEPAVLEPVVSGRDPDARRRQERSDVPPDEAILHGDPFETERNESATVYRGYLAGTNHAQGRVGLTALRRPVEAFVGPILEALGGPWWGRSSPDEQVEALSPDTARRVLQEPGATRVLVTADAPVADDVIAEAAVQEPDRARPALSALLEAAQVALFPASAHDGHDWRLWSAAPMRRRLAGAFRDRPVSGTRRFVIPAAKARSESKFYFDMWRPADADLPGYVEEV